MGWGSEIRDPGKTYLGSGSRGKKALDPGSASATLAGFHDSQIWYRFGRVRFYIVLVAR
jgi:hypothetical protein